MSGALSDLSAGLEAIVTALTTAIPAAHVVRAGGAFDAGEVRRRMTQTPAVIVACLGIDQYSRRPDAWSVSGQWGAYILTRDTPEWSRDLAALDLASDVLRQVARATWDAPDAFGVPDQTSLEASNLYSGTLDSVAVALWAVTWRQDIRLSLTGT